MKFIVVLLTLILVGCSTTPTYNTVELKEVEYIKQEIPKSLTQPCIAKRPYTKEEYLSLKPHEREAYLTGYSIDLLKVISDCNANLEAIRKITTE